MSAQPDGRPGRAAGRRERSVRTGEPEWLSRAASSSPAPHGGSGSPRPRTCTSRDGGLSPPCGRRTRAWQRLREATGAAEDDPRLIGVPLDLDRRSLDHRGGQGDRGGRRRAVRARAQRRYLRGRHGRRNPDEPVGANVRHQRLRPGGADQGAAAVDAGGRPGPIVLVSSAGWRARNARHRTVFRGQGGLERWGESMAGEVAPFGIGVTILVTGTYDTDIITDAGTTDYRDFDGPYARHHAPWTSAAGSP